MEKFSHSLGLITGNRHHPPQPILLSGHKGETIGTDGMEEMMADKTVTDGSQIAWVTNGKESMGQHTFWMRKCDWCAMSTPTCAWNTAG